MMKQYREARASLTPETLLLFRLGDFYEMFEEDAERGAPVAWHYPDQEARYGDGRHPVPCGGGLPR